MFTNVKNITKDSFLNFFILFLPLSLIIGNLAVNINIILICLIGLTIYRFSIFKINRDMVACLLCAFFLYLVLITLINNVTNIGAINTSTQDAAEFLSSGQIKSGYINNQNIGILYKEHIFKSFFFLRFLIFFLVLNKFAEHKKLNYKNFFIFSAFLSFLVTTDVFINFTLNKTIIDQSFIKYFINFFGDENIGGGYIQKFSLFFTFSLILFLPVSANKKIIFITCSFIFFLSSIIASGNRMPLLLYLSSFLFFTIIDIQFRKYSILFLFLFSITIIGIFKFFPTSYATQRIISFTGSTSEIIKKAPELFYYGKFKQQERKTFASGHLVTFNSGVQVWKENKIFGGGLKSFRINCKQDYKFQVCNTHPHNYLIEILVDVGLVGFVFIYIAFATVIINFFKTYFNNFKSNSRYIVMPFFLIFFFEVFPLRSTGSFFTTSTATIIFLTLAVINNYCRNNIYTK
jgi:O-antigen ligase